jgi:hypothetical protein
MYRINYVTSIVKASKGENILVKFLKIINIFAQIAIVMLILQVFNLNSEIETCNTHIENIKKEIKEKRESNYINNIENDWTMYHYKLLAVRQMLSNRTNYGLILKNFAEVIPENIHVAEIFTRGIFFNFNKEFLKEKIKIYENNYKYADEIKAVFENSVYFNKDQMELLGTKEQNINNSNVELLEFKIGCNIRK